MMARRRALADELRAIEAWLEEQDAINRRLVAPKRVR